MGSVGQFAHAMGLEQPYLIWFYHPWLGLGSLLQNFGSNGGHCSHLVCFWVPLEGGLAHSPCSRLAHFSPMQQQCSSIQPAATHHAVLPRSRPRLQSCGWGGPVFSCRLLPCRACPQVSSHPSSHTTRSSRSSRQVRWVNTTSFFAWSSLSSSSCRQPYVTCCQVGNLLAYPKWSSVNPRASIGRLRPGAGGLVWSCLHAVCSTARPSSIAAAASTLPARCRQHRLGLVLG